ncbi:hypothetical protein AVEN_80257-1 [Araneus ventricosus]|uniref:Uncharacterized protein n=1 Tax=Araneus ventricosus TaxID=182803 RepID=A0A4Y2SN26_ARAVE|nr:hypothetical protein AVEN_80257-1 [Araneus ventricosus]
MPLTTITCAEFFIVIGGGRGRECRPALAFHVAIFVGDPAIVGSPDNKKKRIMYPSWAFVTQCEQFYVVVLWIGHSKANSDSDKEAADMGCDHQQMKHSAQQTLGETDDIIADS